MDANELDKAKPSKKTFTINTDNMALLDLTEKAWVDTSLWAHIKVCARDCDGRRAMLDVTINSQGANVIQNRYSEN